MAHRVATWRYHHYWIGCVASITNSSCYPGRDDVFRRCLSLIPKDPYFAEEFGRALTFPEPELSREYCVY